MSEKIRQQSLVELLSNSALFSGLDTDLLIPVAEQAQTVQCEKNEYIDVCTHGSEYFYVIERGSVMLSRVTHNGDNYVIDVLNRGGVFGITNICHNEHDSHLIAQAVSPSKLWRISLTALNELIHKDNEFTHNFLNVNLQSRLNQDIELEHRTVQNVSQRIGCFLLKQCVGVNGNQITINLPYNKNTVAAKLGVRPETFSRVLSRLESEAGIQSIGRKIHIEDIHRLKSYVCQSCSLRYPCQTLLRKLQVY